MTRNEIITRLLSLAVQLEAEGNDMSALAVSSAVAELMLLPARKAEAAQDDLTRAAEQAQAQIARDFDRVQNRIDQVHRDFENIIRVQFGHKHPSGYWPPA